MKRNKIPSHYKNRAARGFLSFNKLSNFGRILVWLVSDIESKQYCFTMIQRVQSLWKRNGPTFTCSYLKESHRLVMKVVSGNPEESQNSPRVATRRGLPLIIPGPVRLRIEAGEPIIIKLTLTILSLYRVIACKPVMKINTITDPFKGLTQVLPEYELRSALNKLSVHKYRLVKSGRLLTLTSAGPNTRVSALGAGLDAIAFSEAPELLAALKAVTKRTGSQLYDLLEKDIQYGLKWRDYLPYKQCQKVMNLKLGRLSEKLEAAGKVRIFAITDIWTQSALAPLHDMLFDILNDIPQDGTFEQHKPIKTLLSRGVKDIYSFDLSAATDRLPIQLQAQILTILFDSDFANAWKTLLSGRPWWKEGVPYYYAVGQPMGALSSWAMLALTHHVIVQIAAQRVNINSWFRDYAILGDDIVIAHKAVAMAYLNLCQELGVEINLSKSLESSQGVAEFAKRLMTDAHDLSPLSPKLVSSLIGDVRQLPSVLRDLVERGLSVEPYGLLKEVPAKSKRVPKTLLWEIIGPLGFMPSEGLSPFLGDSSLSEGELHKFLTIVDMWLNGQRSKMHFFFLEQSYKLLEQFVRGIMMLGDGGRWSSFFWEATDNMGYNPYTDSPYNLGIPFTPSWLMPIKGFPSTIVVQENLSSRLHESWYGSLGSRYDYRVLLGDQQLTFQWAFDYIRQSISDLEDKSSASVPDLLNRSPVRPSRPNRYRIYLELEALLEKEHLTWLMSRRQLTRPELSVK